MWILLAFASAVFAGLTSVLAKAGIRNVDTNLATAIRTVVIVLFAWLIVFMTGSFSQEINTRSCVFLVLSGLATGASWLCYFRALKDGDINKVVPIDKSSTVMTMMLAFILLGEGLTMLKVLCMILLATGTYLMIERQDAAATGDTKRGWLVYAFLAAVFASLTSILGKVGITDINANLGTGIITIVVLIMAWLIVFFQGSYREIASIDSKSWLFLLFSGVATGSSWLCFYRALQLGPASVVVPIDKLSIVISIAFGVMMFKEKLSKKSLAGLSLIVAGTMWLIFI